MRKTPRSQAEPLRVLPEAAKPASEWRSRAAETAPPFDATDERFIDLLVEEAVKAWRARIS